MPNHDVTEDFDEFFDPAHSEAATTPPLAEFRRTLDADSNAWWRTDCGHHLNLFHQAIEELERLERILAEGMRLLGIFDASVDEFLPRLVAVIAKAERR